MDFQSPLGNVLEMNILKGLPFPEGTFDAAYSAQFIEHLTLSEGKLVLENVAKVLKPGGVIRLVTPDLEEICTTYLKNLKTLKAAKSTREIGSYDWIKLEMFDQVVRDKSGGETVKFLNSCDDTTRNYFSERIGLSAESYFHSEMANQKQYSFTFIKSRLHRVPNWILKRLKLAFATEAMKIGAFRLSGEVHRYMHDIYSLTRLLEESGFHSIQRVDAHKSMIPDWDRYKLDVADGVVDGPLALYVEAIR